MAQSWGSNTLQFKVRQRTKQNQKLKKKLESNQTILKTMQMNKNLKPYKETIKKKIYIYKYPN